ncbi:hypothetical protein PHYC_02998 [Phycisphaerales bacterium]|nr:hypothetical protein PHYC_02998 [Phycisphaerales bacterium]
MSTFSPPGGEFAASMQGPQRTSVAAILSLVCGILCVLGCCIPFIGPGLAIIGLLCSVVAFVAIGRSDGRLGGRGAAIGGLICSAVGLILGLSVAVGGSYIVRMFGDNYWPVVQSAQGGDPAILSAHLSSQATTDLSPEELAAFEASTTDSMGKLQKFKPGLWSMVKAGSKMKEIMSSIPSSYEGRLVPFTGIFDKGEAPVLIVMNQQEQGPNQLPKVENIGIVLPGGNIVWLVDPGAP